MPINKRTPHKETLSIMQMINNPTGSGTAFVYSRAKIKKEMNAEFIYLLQRYRKYFSARPYIFPDGRTLFVCKVPSGDFQHNKITYDVLIEIPYEKGKRLSVTNARFFSNSMSFVYTYAYLFYHSDLMINRYADLLPRRCLTDYPVVRNPVLSFGYERSLFFACSYLLHGMCLTDSYIRRFGIRMRSGLDNLIKSQITDVGKLTILYQHSKDMRTKNHRKPVDQTRRKEREQLKHEYIEKRKQDSKTKFTKPARSKLTGRRVRRIFEKK